MKRIAVLLADDNRVVRKGLRSIIELEDDLEVVGEAKDGRQAVAMVAEFRPEVVLMDIAMPVLNGLDATREILKAAPATRVVMLSAHSEDAYVEEANRSGAVGYLIKQACGSEICDAIRKAEKGRRCYSPSIPERFRKRNGKKQTD
jgi:DNA-binding NarL/FixJ family response regulator